MHQTYLLQPRRPFPDLIPRIASACTGLALTPARGQRVRAISRLRMMGIFSVLSQKAGPFAGAAVPQDHSPDPVLAARFRDQILPHLDSAYSLARFLSRDGSAAEDIVQDAFLRAYRGFDQYRGGNPRAWILTIVRNCYRSWHADTRRAAARQAQAPSGGPNADDASDPFDLDDLCAEGDTPEAALLRRREADAVNVVLDSLPEPFREVLVLRELEDLSYREIADITGLTIGTVMSRLARARGLFRDKWQQLTLNAEVGT